MTIKGLEKMLRQEKKMSEHQIHFNKVHGHDDVYEQGYHDALVMVIKNLEEMEEGIPISFIKECIQNGDDWCFDKDTLWSLLDSWEDNKCD